MHAGSALRCLLVWAAVTAAALGAVALAWTTPPPARFDQHVARTAAWALAACASWAWLVTALVVTDAVRGRLDTPLAPAALRRHARRPHGTAPGDTRRWLVPAGARRAVLLACGLAAIAVGPTATAGHAAGPDSSYGAPGPAPAAHAPRAVTAQAVRAADTDRATAATGTATADQDQDDPSAGLDGLPMPERPVGPAHPPRGTPGPSPTPPDADHVVVRPGDSLWRLSVARLGPAAPTAAVAEATWAIYQANRAAVGPDPDLLHPGTRLRVPATDPTDPTHRPRAEAGEAP